MSVGLDRQLQYPCHRFLQKEPRRGAAPLCGQSKALPSETQRRIISVGALKNQVFQRKSPGRPFGRLRAGTNGWNRTRGVRAIQAAKAKDSTSITASASSTSSGVCEMKNSCTIPPSLSTSRFIRMN
jgi:hypothetical protein